MKTIIKVGLIGCLYLLNLTSAYSQLQYLDLRKLKVEGPPVDSVRPQINKSKPLFIDGNVVNKNVGQDIMFSCIITPFTTAIGGVYSFNNESDWKEFRDSFPDSLRQAVIDYRGKASYAWLGSKSIKEALRYLYGKQWRRDSLTTLRYLPQQLPNSRVVFADGLDTTGLVTFSNGVIKRQNGYTIQLTTTRNPSYLEMAKVISNAIEFQFGLSCVFEKRIKKCIIFSRNKYPIQEYTSGEIELKNGVDKNGRYHLLLNKVLMEKLVDKLEDYFPFTQYPFIDETGFTKHLGNLELWSDGPELNYKILRENLEKQGIKVSIENREVDVLVIGPKTK